ncbi:MAG: transcriptional regulator NrdR [Planctomycetota bacterium]
MRCPHCNDDDDRVLDSRLTEDATAIRRRRLCNACGQRFTTYERVEGEEQLRVVKRDGRIEFFDRTKLLKGLLVACEKRPVATDRLEAAVNLLHQGFLTDGRREVSSQDLGAAVMDELRGIDEVAYVRFASVYRQFRSVDYFFAELRSVLADGGAAGGAEGSR